MSTSGPQLPPEGDVPSAAELQRALASVTGVRGAEVTRGDNGRDRLRISLVPGEDPEAVAWSVAATLRERFGIALDPAAITARMVDTDDDPVRVVHPDVQGSSASIVRPSPTPPRSPQDQGPDPAAPPGPPPSEDLVAAARAALAAAGHTDPWPAPVQPTLVERPDVDDTDATALRLATRSGPTPVADLEADAGAAADAGAEADAGGEADARSEADAGAGAEVDAAERRHARRQRAAIRELTALPDGDELHVAATLGLSGREVTGRARGVRTRRGRWRAIAEATLDALDDLTVGRVRGNVDHVTVLTFADLAHVSVSVTLLTEHGEETFLGAALVRDDPDRAVMRAALDAVNRRVEPWLADAVAATG